ncbi:hypothetical protein JCM11491_002480 [Sporobolomyces phaffii]
MSYQPAQRYNPTRPYVSTPSYDSFTPPATSAGGASTPASSSSASAGSDSDRSSSDPRAARAAAAVLVRNRGGSVGAKDKLRATTKDEAIYMGGGTGVVGLKEPKAVVRKRVTFMIISGLIIAAIITVAVLGVKKIL